MTKDESSGCGQLASGCGVSMLVCGTVLHGVFLAGVASTSSIADLYGKSFSMSLPSETRPWSSGIIIKLGRSFSRFSRSDRTTGA